MLQPPEFTSENVEGFPVKEILVRFLSHIYDIQVAVIDSVNFGLPVARLRSYQIGRHKLKTLGPSKSLADHTHALQRPVAFGWEENCFGCLKSNSPQVNQRLRFKMRF